MGCRVVVLIRDKCEA